MKDETTIAEDPRLLKIGKKLKELREKASQTSYETFAWDNNITRMQYWRMEKGKNFQFTSLLRILDAHEITLEEFFKGIE